MTWNAYPLAWATHAAHRAAAARWQRRGLLTAEQRAAIEAAYPLAYYRPAVFLRIGLFLFTWMGVVSAVGLWSAITDFTFGVGGTGLLLGLGSLAALEYAIRQARHYRSGLDNALLYIGLGSLYGISFNFFDTLYPPIYELPNSWLLTAQAALLLALLVLALRRYADPLVAAVAFLTGLGLLSSLLLHCGWGRLLLPFAVMAGAAALHRALRRELVGPREFYYYQARLVLRGLALTTLYLAGNYLVVREGNAALLGQPVAGQIPFAPLFYAFTALIPLVYLYFALRGHDRLMLWLGVLALAFSLFTLRYYHAVLSPAWAATLAGAALVTLSLAALRYLRRPRHRLTAQPDAAAPPLFNLETLVVAQTATVPAAPTPHFEFGGGQSGGGGAEGRF